MDMAFPSKYYGVEALRFFAAGIVVVTHATFFARERNDATTPVWHFGEAGVHIFFVISGFVIVLAASRRDGVWVTPAYFAIRRMLRILPMYWLATTINLAVLVAMPTLVLHSSLDWSQVVKSYFLIPDYNLDGRIEPLLGVAWTLYFESFFYALFACSLLLKVSPLWAVPVALSLCFGLSFFRSTDWPPITVYANPIVLEFAGGMALAVFRKRINLPALSSFFIFAVGVILLVVLGEMGGNVPGQGHDRGGLHDLVYRGGPSFLVVLGTVALDRYINWKRLEWLLLLGGASYSLYLFHPLIGPAAPVLLTRLGVINGALSTVLSTVLSIAIAVAIYRVLEQPLMRFFNRNSTRARAASTA